MATKTITKQLQKTKRRFEYVIKVNGKEVWRGSNPTKVYWEIRKNNSGKEVGIAWEREDDIIIC